MTALETPRCRDIWQPLRSEHHSSCSRGHCRVVSRLHSCRLLPLCLPLVSSPTRVEPVSLSACEHGASPWLGGRVTDDIIPTHGCGSVCECLMGRQKVTPLVTVTRYPSHPPKFLLWLGECVELVITRSFICKTIMTLTLSWYPWGTGLLLIIAQAKHLASTGWALNSTHSYKQTSWPLFIVALLQREVFTKANKQSSNLISKPCHVYH